MKNSASGVCIRIELWVCRRALGSKRVRQQREMPVIVNCNARDRELYYIFGKHPMPAEGKKRCCSCAKNYSMFCGWCCCSLRTGFVLYFAMTIGLAIALLFISIFETVTQGFYSVPNYILAGLSFLFAILGFIAILAKKSLWPIVYGIFKILIVMAVVYDIYVVIIYIVCLSNIEWYYDVFGHTTMTLDEAQTYTWLGIGLGFYLLGMIFRYWFFYFLVGSFRSLQAVYDAGGDGGERKSATKFAKEAHHDEV